jgi:hypothetical protein
MLVALMMSATRGAPSLAPVNPPVDPDPRGGVPGAGGPFAGLDQGAIAHFDALPTSQAQDLSKFLRSL